MTAPLEVVYSHDLLDWRLGDDHPTDPVRARRVVELLEADRALDVTVVAPQEAAVADLCRVHAKRYVARVLRGRSDEWPGRQPRLGQVASLMAGGTLGAARRIIAGSVDRVFCPQGAKHHAHWDHSSGFCVFNDMAAAAHLFADAGWRVLYVDWDAHHGDGVEALLYGRTDLVTWSAHNVDNFPGTGHFSWPRAGMFNVPLRWGADGRQMVSALGRFLADTAVDVAPDVVLVAAGADGHVEDPLGGLDYELGDYWAAGRIVRQFADEHCGGRILIGGAGGYQPVTWTPKVWHTAVRAMALPV